MMEESRMNKRTGVIIVILTLLTATACSSTADATERIAEIMGEERRTETAIELVDSSVDSREYGEGKQSFRDDWWEYIYDPEGYLISCHRTDRGADTDREADTDSGTSTKAEQKERALNLHLRNFSRNQTHEYIVREIYSGMGATIYEIIEMKDGNPTGRRTSVQYSASVLYSLVSYCRPVTPTDPSATGKISEEQAAKIAYAALRTRLGSVLTFQTFEETHWSAEKTTAEGRSAWLITIDELDRTDFPSEIDSWSVLYWIDEYTGKIILYAEAA